MMDKEQNGVDLHPTFDWDGFKQKKFAVRCEDCKEHFFDDCKQHGIYCFLSEFAKKRNLFVCAKRYDDHFSNGRYELFTLQGWETGPNGMYGKEGLEEVIYG